MIKNQRQYRITKAQAQKFAHALAAAEARRKGNPLLADIEAKALRSQLDELQGELASYEKLRARGRTIHAASLDDLPRTLVQARIAAGLSQKDLADRLGLKQQQVQRYEATDYRSASLTRLRKVISALGLRLRLRAELKPSARGEAVKLGVAGASNVWFGRLT